MMFCTSLRRRPSFAPVISKLTGPQNLGLKGMAPLAKETWLRTLTGQPESQLNTHDLALPIAANADPKRSSLTATRRLRVLLFSPSATTSEKLQQTVERIRRFAALTGGQDLAIVFLLNPPKDTFFTSAKGLKEDTADVLSGQDGMIAYTKFQATLLDHGDIPHVPILPLTSLDTLPELLRKHVEALSQPPQKTKPPTTPFALLQLCTANPPMYQQTAFILSDLFPNLQELAKACTSVSSAPNSSSPSVRAVGGSFQVIGAQGSGLEMSMQYSDDRAASNMKQLRDLVGEQEFADIVDFWSEEYTVD